MKVTEMTQVEKINMIKSKHGATMGDKSFEKRTFFIGKNGNVSSKSVPCSFDEMVKGYLNEEEMLRQSGR